MTKTAIVTGANAGLGYAITKALAAKGYDVVMACRNKTKAEEARDSLLAAQPDAKLRIIVLDISDLDSVTHFAEEFQRQGGNLQLLINNAGITAVPLSRTSRGHEMQMATNYLGNFALIGKLLPLFDSTQPCRIVNVGSLAHRFGKLELDDLNWHRDTYKPMKSYARSKVAFMSYTQELNRRLAGSNIIALAAHPGFAATEITKKASQQQKKSAFKIWMESKMEPLIPTPADAARPILHAALADNAKGGDYYGPGGFLEIAGKPAPAKLNPVTRDHSLGARLWTLSEEMTGTAYLSDQ